MERGSGVVARRIDLHRRDLEPIRLLNKRPRSTVVQIEELVSQYARRWFVVEQASSKFHCVPDALWERIEPLLPKYKPSPNGGRPRLLLRNVVTGILYVLRTGCQWKAMPREFGSGSAIHDYFQQWVQQGVFHRLWQEALQEYDELASIDWEWQSLDGAMTKSPLGGEKNREKPDRSWQARRQAFGADRRTGRADWRSRCRRQCA